MIKLWLLVVVEYAKIFWSPVYFLVVPSYNNTIIMVVFYYVMMMVNDDDYYRSEQCAVFGSTHEHHKICMQSRYGELICTCTIMQTKKYISI